MDKKTILSWTAKILLVVALVIIIAKLEDKFGEGRVMLNGLAFAGLLVCIAILLKKK